MTEEEDKWSKIDLNYLKNKFIGNEILIFDMEIKYYTLYKIKRICINSHSTYKEFQIYLFNKFLNKNYLIFEYDPDKFENGIIKISASHMIVPSKINYLNNLIKYKLAQGIK